MQPPRSVLSRPQRSGVEGSAVASEELRLALLPHTRPTTPNEDAWRFRYACFVTDSTSLFVGVPGPTPWYSRPGNSTVEGFHWEQAGGVTRLVEDAGGVVAVLGYYNYVMKLDSSTLLIWNQKTERESETESTPPVHLVVIQPRLLPRFGDQLESAASRIERAGRGAGLALMEAPAVSMYLRTDVIEQNISAVFPKELHAMDELLILCDSSAIAPREDGINANLALLVANPKQSVYRLYPQDWFNSSDLDFGYQWITRVARDPQTGRVHGEGFRLKPFELDDSLRQLAQGTMPQSDFYRGV